MKKLTSLILCCVLVFGIYIPVFAAQPTGLTWDGKPATLAEIAENTGYDMVDTNGNYKPLYYYYATQLWNNGLFMGSEGSFDLDSPLTRAQGVVMTLRLLGKEAEAKAAAAPITFGDVAEWARPYVAYAVQNGIASGYSTDIFGADDPMTAAQFITFTLRAMGYKDGEDFAWDKSYDKALEIGLIGQPCHTQYSRSNLFMRDNAAVIAYNAVFKAPLKSGGMLKDSVSMANKPSGEAPAATATLVADSKPATPAAFVEETKQTTPASNLEGSKYPSNFEIITLDRHFRTTILPGNNTYATAEYYLFIGDYGGTIDYKITVSPGALGNTKLDSFEVTAGEGRYVQLAFGFSVTPSLHGQNVTNSIKIQVGDYVYTDTINMAGTLYSIVIR